MRHTKYPATGKVDLTPMLDVVFIMLIFFVVTATFVREFGLPINPPEPNINPPPIPKQSRILVRITSNDQIMIEGQTVDVRAIRANFERLHAERPDAPLILLPHTESTTATMVRVMDTARLVGINALQLALSE